jgi:hypothetical protein
METMIALSQLSRENIKFRTHPQYLIDSQPFRTGDNENVWLLTHRNRHEQWYVIMFSHYAGWTGDFNIAYNVVGNCALFTLKEMWAGLRG